VLNQLEDRRAACVTTTNLMLLPGIFAIAADITGIVFISLSGIPVLDHIARAGTVWLGASLLMVFIFQPILMSYLPSPRHTRNFERNRKLGRRLEPLVDRIVEGAGDGGDGAQAAARGRGGVVGVGSGVGASTSRSATTSRARRCTGRRRRSISTPERLGKSSRWMRRGAVHDAAVSAHPIGAWRPMCCGWPTICAAFC